MFTIDMVAFGESTYKGFVSPGGDNSAYEVPLVVKNTISAASVSCAMTNHAVDATNLNDDASGHTAFMSTNSTAAWRVR